MIDVDDAAHAIEIDQPEIVSELVVGFLTLGEAFFVDRAKSPNAGVR